MLTPELDKFNQMYSEFVSEFINLYNSNFLFSVSAGKDPGHEIRSSLKNISISAKVLRKQCLLAYKERKQNLKDEKKAAIAYKKANPQKRGPKPKNVEVFVEQYKGTR